ncbi:tol-pal system protein YbgF [Bacteroidales bacterium Barb4]|nr:tol-pal system protein YbgF [Bacteroidales bacterium Barb4]
MMKKLLFIPLCLLLSAGQVAGQRSRSAELPEHLFAEGKELFGLKNYAGATDKLEAYRACATDADLVQEAAYMLACAAFEQRRGNAGLLLEKYLADYPDSRHGNEVYYMTGSVSFARGDYQEALRRFRETDIDRLDAERQEAYSFCMAYALLQTGDLPKARGYFANISRIGTVYRAAADYYTGYVDYATGKYGEALAVFSRLRNVTDYRELSLYYITQIYFIQNKYELVIKEGEAVIAAFPSGENSGEVYRMLGNAYYQLGNQERAANRLGKYVAAEDAPLRGDLYLLGICYFNRKDYTRAADRFGRTIREHDALSQNAYLYLGQSYLKLKEKNNARMAFEAAATAPFDEQIREAALYNYALLIHETNFTGFGESVGIFEGFLNDFPHSKYADKVNDYLAEVYMTTKNYQAALVSIEKIHRPGNKILEAKQNVLFQLGTQAFANAKTDEAAALFTRAIEAGAHSPEVRSEAYFWRGESCYRQEQYAKAAADYRTYLNNTRHRNTDMYALAHYNLGYCCFKQQDYEEALPRFRQYTILEKRQAEPSLADAFNRIGDCLFFDRRFAQAEENYDRAAQLLPSAGDYPVYQKGFILGLQKDYAGKIREMDRLLSDFPESPYADNALYEKGRACVLLNKNREAVETFETLISRYPNSSLARKAGIQSGLIYFNENQPIKAAEAYKKVIDNYPGSEEARVALEDLKSVYVDMNEVNAYTSYVRALGGKERMEASEEDSLTYLAAERLFMRGDNEAAGNSLARYLQKFPQGAFSANANFRLGSIAFAKKEYEEAKQLFTRVLDSGNTKFGEESTTRKAEIEYLEADYAVALTTFRQLLLLAEDPTNKGVARLGIMRCALLTNQMQEALSAADNLLKDAKLSPELAAEARYVRAKALIGTGKQTIAAADLKELAKDTRTAQGAEAKYLLAQLYYDTKDDAAAVRILEDYAKNGTPHPYWLARGFILWADIYIRQGDHVQARVYLNSLQSNYKAGDDIEGMIKNRLGKLKK